jgi:hypothetical protein
LQCGLIVVSECASPATNLKGEEGAAAPAKSSAGKFSSEEKGQINEYAALMAGKGKTKTGNPLEDMLFNDMEQKKAGGCVVC